MTVSDFLAGAPSTHALLYRLFASEIGLSSVAHTSVQFDALAQATADLKKQAIAAMDGGCHVHLTMPNHELVSVAITGRDEAHLFIELYRELDMFTGGVAFADAYSQSVTMAQVVYPKTARAIEASAAFTEAVLRQLSAQAKEHGPAVRERIANDLTKKFRFSSAFCAQFEQQSLNA